MQKPATGQVLLWLQDFNLIASWTEHHLLYSGTMNIMSEPLSGALDRQGASTLWPISAVALSFRAQWIFFVVPLLFLAGNEYLLWGVPAVQRAPWTTIFLSFFVLTLPAALIALFVVRLFYFALFLKPASPSKAMFADVWRFITSPLRIINGLPIVAAMFVFNKAVLDLKPNIQLIAPFSWDETLMQIDRAIHFGVDPWQLLQPLFGFAWLTFGVNLVYNFWFLALFGLWVWFGFRPDFNALRTRFFLSYMIAWWVGGGILALVFSSAGPCYYGLTGLSPDPYLPLMDYLHGVDGQIPIWALDAQELLWDGYTGEVKPAVGISAFPSMHNAMAMIFALAGWRIHRIFGLILSANVAVILLGSVHLGWHYAVDGYAGIAIALFAWWLSAPIARWFHSLPTSQEYQRQLSP